MVTGDECLELMQVVAAKIQFRVNQITTCECEDFGEIQHWNDSFIYFFAASNV